MARFVLVLSVRRYILGAKDGLDGERDTAMLALLISVIMMVLTDQLSCAIGFRGKQRPARSE